MDLRKSLLNIEKCLQQKPQQELSEKKKQTMNNEKVNIDISVLDDKNNVNFLLLANNTDINNT